MATLNETINILKERRACIEDELKSMDAERIRLLNRWDELKDEFYAIDSALRDLEIFAKEKNDDEQAE